MKLSTLGALLNNDIASAIISETPGGIEAQERRGQTTFVAGDMLPKDISGATREQLIRLGFIFGDDVDDLFIKAKLPAGWQKKATDHSMHSIIIDEKGRERASIFYKAAFYDRRADMSMSRRYQCGVEPINGWDNERDGWKGYVKDGESILWESVMTDPEPDYKGNRNDESKRQAWLDWLSKKDGLGELAESWLSENFPDWRNPLTYWD